MFWNSLQDMQAKSFLAYLDTAAPVWTSEGITTVNVLNMWKKGAKIHLIKEI